MATIPTIAEEEGAAAPAVVVVGEVVHVLLERGERVLHGAIGRWGEAAATGAAVKEAAAAVPAVAAVSAKLGGMRGGGGSGGGGDGGGDGDGDGVMGKGKATGGALSLPRRLLRAARAVFVRG